MRVFLDGTFLDHDEAKISVNDRGFLFGDGVYEVVRSHDGELVEPERHWRRLGRSLRALAIGHAEWLGDMELSQLARRLVAENGLESGPALVYLQVTRGAAWPRTHHFPPADTPPTVYASAARFQIPDALRARGARVITVPDIRWARCDIKSVNLLPNVLAKQQATAAGADEAVFVRNGVVTEASTANVFAVVDDVIRTHPATPQILGGITRELVIEAAESLGLPLDPTPIFADDLPRASELFFTNTTHDVMPVVRVDEQVIGSGKPGPIANRLMSELARRLYA